MRALLSHRRGFAVDLPRRGRRIVRRDLARGHKRLSVRYGLLREWRTLPSRTSRSGSMKAAAMANRENIALDCGARGGRAARDSSPRADVSKHVNALRIGCHTGAHSLTCNERGRVTVLESNRGVQRVLHNMCAHRCNTAMGFPIREREKSGARPGGLRPGTAISIDRAWLRQLPLGREHCRRAGGILARAA